MCRAETPPPGGGAAKRLQALPKRSLHTPLEAEIKGSIESGSAGALVESGPLLAFFGKAISAGGPGLRRTDSTFQLPGGLSAIMLRQAPHEAQNVDETIS